MFLPGCLALLQLSGVVSGLGFVLGQFGLPLPAGFTAVDEAVQLVVDGHGFFIEAAQFFVVCRHDLQQGLAFSLGRCQFLGGLFFFCRRRHAAVLGFGQEAFAVAQFLQGHGPFIGQALAVEAAEFLQSFCLFLQWFQPLFEDAHEVADALQVALGLGDLAQAVGLAAFEAADASNFFKDDPPLFGLAVEDAVDAVLADDGHRVLADTRIGEEDMDIFQAARPAVDIVFTVAGAEEAPRDDDFREFRIQGVVAVIEVQRDFRCPLGPAGLGPGKDDVFRLLPPQLADILFPHDPADGIGNIALAAAIGTDDGRNALVEGQGRLICKGLESPQFHFQ